MSPTKQGLSRLQEEHKDKPLWVRTPSGGMGVFHVKGCRAKSEPKKKGEAFLLTVGGVLLLTVKLLCLQSLEALIRRTFPL